MLDFKKAFDRVEWNVKHQNFLKYLQPFSSDRVDHVVMIILEKKYVYNLSDIESQT